jgi:alpha-methylacyl-CoA racemase
MRSTGSSPSLPNAAASKPDHRVIDAAMTDGSALLMTAFYGYMQTAAWSAERGANIVDSGAPFHDVYETADGRWLSVAAMEPHFHAARLEILGLADQDLPPQHDKARRPQIKERFPAVIRSRTRDQWCTAAEGVEAWIAPVLAFEELEHAGAIGRDPTATTAASTRGAA